VRAGRGLWGLVASSVVSVSVVVTCSASSPQEGEHPAGSVGADEGDGRGEVERLSVVPSLPEQAGAPETKGSKSSEGEKESKEPKKTGGALRLALGVHHSCALERGELRCWGINRFGILGVGEPEVDKLLAPQRVPGLPPVLEVVADYDFTCALVEGGAVYCWGDNDSGQLGDGTTDRRSEPTRVDVPVADGIVAGFRRGCAATGGGFECWGTGTLGDGSEHYREAPLPIAELRGVDRLALSDGHACTLRGAEVRCWGDNSRGQLGNGEGGCRNLREACPGSRCLPPKECKRGPTPVRPRGLPPVVSVAVGGSRSYALDETGTVWSWGQEGTSLDFGEDNPRYRPQVLAGVATMVEVDANGGHACGRTGAGKLWCWGENAYGELGHPPGPRGGIEEPSLVEGLPPVRAFALGFHHTCAITGAEGSEAVWCWGDNSYGQLGDGTTERRHRPVEVRL